MGCLRSRASSRWLCFLRRRDIGCFIRDIAGVWESGGEFLERSPHLDILDVVRGFSREFRELAFGRRFRLRADEVFVIGGSFGGAAAILCSLDPRVKKVVANCPVVDWAILSREQKKETSNPSYAAYIRAAFGNGYRLSDRNWRKLSDGKFYNPAYHAREIMASKVLMFHAEDDPYIPYRSVVEFSPEYGSEVEVVSTGRAFEYGFDCAEALAGDCGSSFRRRIEKVRCGADTRTECPRHTSYFLIDA